MSDTVISELYIDHPTILLKDERTQDTTILYVDVTPQQETQIIPVLKDRLIRIETVV